MRDSKVGVKPDYPVLAWVSRGGAVKHDFHYCGDSPRTSAPRMLPYSWLLA